MTRWADRTAAEQPNAVSKRSAGLALLLLVPAASIGPLAAMLLEATRGSPVGQAIYVLCKAWIAVLPVLWLVLVDKGRLSWSPPRRGGFAVAAGLGVLISAVIVLAYWLLGDRLIDERAAEEMRTVVAEIGLESKAKYLGLTVYICLFNSLMEEYVWRWFVFRKCEALVGGAAGVALSALFFTLHHILALSAYFDWPVVALGSAGVFIGGATWSWCYLKFRSIWPGYVSHLIVDVTVLWIGWQLIYGGQG